MHLLKRYTLLVAMSLLTVFPSLSQNDSIRCCLMTCSPGTEVYSLYGHTALRYQNLTRNIDLVFNYGMFSFNTPHFLYRFVKGETDYQLGVVPFRYFLAEYDMRGSSVYEQELNLTQQEKQRLYYLLSENYKKENRTYRYNYFFDNCTTRARDMIEASILGKVVYPDGLPNKSFRKIIHEFSLQNPWNIFGTDLCLGAEADRTIDNREQMFSPIYMKGFASGAYIQTADSTSRPFLAGESVLVKGNREDEPALPFTPSMFGVLFLALNVLIGWIQVQRRKIYWGWDVLTLLSQGIAGCVIAFLFFFSVHPTVGSNWMILLFNPVPLLALPYVVYTGIKGRKNPYFLCKMVYLTLFIALFPFLPQEFNITILPLALGLLVSSASHVLVYTKKI